MRLIDADAIIPLNDEQAEAFKALSESIKTEQSLRDEVALLRQSLADTRQGGLDSAALYHEAKAEVARLTWMVREQIATTCPFGERSQNGIETCPNCSAAMADLAARYEAERDA